MNEQRNDTYRCSPARLVRLAPVALVLTALLAGCGATGAEEPRVDIDALVRGNTSFALDLYGGVAADTDVAENVFMSPLSVSTALTMTYAGARGATASEMAAVLTLPDPDPAAALAGFGELNDRLAARAETSGYVLRQANSLWGQKGYPFRDEFLSLVSGGFGAEFSTVDFVNETEKARKDINAWVERKTNDRIKDLIPRGALDSSSVLVLTNAVYFKGDWKTKFDPDATYDATFRSPAGETDVEMMHRVDRYGYFEDDAVRLLELPYEGGDLSMVVALPVDDAPSALTALESSLSDSLLSSWVDGLSMRKIDVHLPRFRIEWGTEELRNELKALGMKQAFRPDAADFSGIGATRDLFISFVLHKAFVEVNEEGSEAAAATAVGIARTSVPTPPPVFKADRPFLFMIRDRRSGSVLFLGRLSTPAS
jgi:serpin B